jgi:hypothetical protein
LKKHYRKVYQLLAQKRFYLNEKGLLCLKNKTTNNDRLVIPTNLIPTALHYIHKSSHFSHPGKNQTQLLVEDKFWWFGYPTDIKKYIKQCTQCQLAKGHKFHMIGLLNPLQSHETIELLHIDFLGTFHHDLSIMLLVDNYSGYTMLIPTFGQTADIVIRAIWNNWRPICGIPKQILTDRGAGFISELNLKFYDIFGIRKFLQVHIMHKQTQKQKEEYKKQKRHYVYLT